MRIYEKIETMAQTTGEFFFPSKDTARLFVDQYEGMMFLFGDPLASEEMILRGDGGHIGTELQAVNRFLAYFHWQHNQWQANPNVNARGIVRQEHLSIPSEAFQGTYQLEVVLPPGYDLPENANERYPVVLFLHGYGQTADNLAKSSGLFTKFMASNTWDKTIFVYPDGSCGKDRTTQCNDGIDNDGDGLIDARSDARQESTDPECGDDEGRRSESGDYQPRCNDGVDNDGDGSADLSDEGCLLASEDSEGECVVGSFYSKHVAQRNGRAGGRDFEGAMMDALRYIDANYRTKASEIVTIEP
jgi:hypothetical protein